jgi:hypothetical protein
MKLIGMTYTSEAPGATVLEEMTDRRTAPRTLRSLRDDFAPAAGARRGAR